MKTIHRIGSGLLVVLLLLGMMGERFPSRLPDCCAGKTCPVHHQHPMRTDVSADAHMDCEHEKMGLGPCSMSCSHSGEERLQPSVVFLLPSEGVLFELLPVENSRIVNSALRSDRTVRPLIPPPRFQASL
jgi:hypothetical protein